MRLCGGIPGSRKVAAMAKAYNVMVVPHNPLSPAGLIVCLQLDAAIPKFLIQEYSTGFEADVMKLVNRYLACGVVDDAPVPVDGFVTIPDRHGIGIDLVDDPAAIRPLISKPVLMRMHADGSPVDQ